MQRPTSTDDQIRECRDAAQRNGWTVLDEYIRSDQAKTGQLLTGREGLEDLMMLAEQTPRPFDCILIDDTSRFGRNLSDTLPKSDVLEFLDVFLYFVNRRLDSRDPNFRTIFVQYGQQDEQYSRGTGEKVHRGQRGRVLNGCVASGRLYGYRNVPIENPHRKSLYGRPAVESVKREIIPEEAAVVLRIFELYVSGLGYRTIARKLNAEGVPSSLKSQSKIRRAWNSNTIADILRNDKYRGIHVWNKTKGVRNPIAKRKERRARPESEWERVDVPSWRIVPEELWKAVQEQIKRKQGRCWRTEGGLNRTESSRKYIFSGLMVCSDCGNGFNIVGGKGPTARYGCSGHRNSGSCNNALTITRQLLEEQLLEALKQNIFHPAVREQLCHDFRKQITAAWNDRIARSRKLASELPTLKQRQRELHEQADNLVNAIAQTGGSALLYERLKSVETQIQGTQQLLAASIELDSEGPSAEAIDNFLKRKLEDFDSVITADPELARQKLRKYLEKLVMRPVRSTESPRYEVTGDIRLFGAADDAMGKDDVLLHGSFQRTVEQYTSSASIPFLTFLKARNPRPSKPRAA